MKIKVTECEAKALLSAINIKLYYCPMNWQMNRETEEQYEALKYYERLFSKMLEEEE